MISTLRTVIRVPYTMDINSSLFLQEEIKNVYIFRENS